MAQDMDLKAVLEILRFVNKSDIAEVEISMPDFELKVKRTPDGAPAYYTVAAPPPLPVAAPAPLVTPAPVAASAPAAAAPAAAPAASAAPAPAPAAASGPVHEILSPMVGTFYRSAGPDKPAYVNVGDVVRKGQVLCIIEAMKLFNEIESDVDGKIVKILPENAKPVEYDQVLFVIEPA